MRRIGGMLLAAALAACAAQRERPVASLVTPAPGSAFALPYLQRELANGLRAIVVRTPHPDIVTLQIPVQTGSRNEIEPGKSGFAHFFEHMMFRGTERVSAEQYTQAMQAAGAASNAYTSDDVTNYHTTFTKADLAKVLEIEADRFQNLKYSEAQFRTEALAVKGEYLKNSANPSLKMFETLRAMAFKVHPYRHTPLGLLADIEAMPEQFEYSRTFFNRWYRPETTTLILAGDVEPEAAFRLVERYWGGWQGAGHGVAIPQEPAPAGPGYRHVRWLAPTQPLIAVAFRGPAFKPGDRALPALELLAQLHFSKTSDLYQKVVSDKRWADSLDTWIPQRADPSLLAVVARLNDAAHAGRVAGEIAAALVRARTERIGAQKLAAVKANARYAFAASLDSSRAIGEMLARYAHFERSAETVNAAYRTLDAVTADDLLEQANRWFVDSHRFVVSVAGEAALPEVAALPSLDIAVAELRARSADELARVLLPSASPLVDVSLLFHSGAAQDPPGKKGLAALTAALIADGGSAARSRRELAEAYFPLAAGLSAQVDKEMTRFAGSVHRDNLETWYALVKEQVLTPGWREDDFARLQQRQINAIRTDLRANNDEELAKEVLYALIYGRDHPYGSFNAGRVRDLQSITLADVRAFYARHYTSANLTIGLAGDYGEALPRQLQADLARLPAGARRALAVPPAPPRHGRRAAIVEKETPSVAVSFGFPIALRRGDPDWLALWVARSWLGEHRSHNGRLMQRIREERGLNYGAYAYEEYFPGGMFSHKPGANLGRQQQIFQVWLRPLRNNADAVFATRAALYEIEQLREHGLSEAEFTATRDFLDKYASQLVDAQPRALGYALDSRYYGIPAFADYARQGLRKLTREDVNRVAREHLRTDAARFVYVARDAEGLRSALLGHGGLLPAYDSPQPATRVEQDRRIAATALGFDAKAVSILRLEGIFD